MSEPKKYGLQLNKKAAAKALLVKKPSVFGDDSDEEDATKELNKKLLDEAAKAKVKKTTKLAIEKALNEDASVYEYDSLYDDMQAKKQAKVGLKKTSDDNKPKYIHNLLKSAELRKKEYERRVERTVQKEREEEGDKFADKESFVTSAYKKKMEEIAAAEEKERQEAQMEDILDVTRQGNLNAFYHNLYRTTTDDEPTIKKEKIDDDPPIKKEKIDDNEDEGTETVEKPEKQRDAMFSNRRLDKRDGEKRKYRSRRHSSTNSIGDKQSDSDDDTNQGDITRKEMEDLDKDDSESDNEAKEETNDKDPHNIKNGVRKRKNKRKPSSSESDSDDDSDKSKHRKQSKSLKKHKNNENKISTTKSEHGSDSNGDESPKVIESIQNKENTQPKPKKPMTMREKYARKTTDAEIEAARQRYFLRKQARA
ncbi:unnamed protein product [Owenia fusiformis]|uniref:Uncharacterized protein n=1 Tax=Owenia fusiformis TaxID=6347 RepID=A0A8J1XMA1_OWEFU|nr:unnamed protein product [Owenia fusiformis]